MLQDGRAAIAVSLTEETTGAVVARMAALCAIADLFEVRADFVRDLDLAALKDARTKPILFTCRPESEGGRWPDADPAGRRALLRRAVDLGFDPNLTGHPADRIGRGATLGPQGCMGSHPRSKTERSDSVSA